MKEAAVSSLAIFFAEKERGSYNGVGDCFFFGRLFRKGGEGELQEGGKGERAAAETPPGMAGEPGSAWLFPDGLQGSKEAQTGSKAAKRHYRR